MLLRYVFEFCLCNCSSSLEKMKEVRNVFGHFPHEILHHAEAVRIFDLMCLMF